MVGVNDLCTRNCVAVQPSHFRMPLRFASRLSSTDLIAPLRSSTKKYIYIYTSRLHASLPRRHRRKYETRREEIEIALNISWIQEEKRFSRETLPRLVQPCAFPPLEQIERDCLEKQKNRALLAFENRPRCFVVAVGWKLFSFLSTFFLFFFGGIRKLLSREEIVIETKRNFYDSFLQFVLYCKYMFTIRGS